MWDFLLGSVWAWVGGTTIFVAAALAVAWFIRPLRPYSLMVAAGALAIGGFAIKVAAAATKRKQKEWDDAERKSIERGKKARLDAERAERNRPAGGVRGDKFDRDNQ